MTIGGHVGLAVQVDAAEEGAVVGGVSERAGAFNHGVGSAWTLRRNWGPGINIAREYLPLAWVKEASAETAWTPGVEY